MELSGIINYLNKIGGIISGTVNLLYLLETFYYSALNVPHRHLSETPL